MKKLVPVFWIALIAVAGGMLMSVSYQVEFKERQLAKLHQSIEARADSIRVLRAEWSYLNQPQRLEALTQKYLKLQPLNVAQVQMPASTTKAVAQANIPAPAKSSFFPSFTLASYSNRAE